MKDRTLKQVSYTFLAGPAIFIYAAVIVFPIIYSFVLSFMEWGGSGVPKFVGMANYVKMFQDPIFLHGLRNNAGIILISVFGQISARLRVSVHSVSQARASFRLLSGHDFSANCHCAHRRGDLV